MASQTHLRPVAFPGCKFNSPPLLMSAASSSGPRCSATWLSCASSTSCSNQHDADHIDCCSSVIGHVKGLPSGFASVDNSAMHHMQRCMTFHQGGCCKTVTRTRTCAGAGCNICMPVQRVKHPVKWYVMMTIRPHAHLSTRALEGLSHQARIKVELCAQLWHCQLQVQSLSAKQQTK